MKNVIPYLLVALFLISGCIPGYYYYLRNYTAEEVEIIFTRSPRSEVDFETYYLKFLYANEIKEISTSLSGEFENELLPTRISSDTLVINVPPNSTVKINKDYFGSLSNHYESMQFRLHDEFFIISFNTNTNNYPIESKRIKRRHYATYIDLK